MHDGVPTYNNKIISFLFHLLQSPIENNYGQIMVQRYTGQQTTIICMKRAIDAAFITHKAARSDIIT